MNFTQLRDADPGALDGVVLYWQGEAERLGDIESRSSWIADIMSSGEWQGAGYEAAITTMEERRSQIAEGRAEAMRVAEIVAEAQRQITAARRVLLDILSEMEQQGDFVVDDHGVVSPVAADDLAALLPIAEFTTWQRNSTATAIDLTDRIAEAVNRARTADETAATALRQAIRPATEGIPRTDVDALERWRDDA